jgi:DNA-directed RNA polymerase specialized sigma24 family protein
MRLRFRLTGCLQYLSRCDWSPSLARMEARACSKHAERQFRRGRCGPLRNSQPPNALRVDPSKSRQLDSKRLEWQVADHASNPEEECTQSEIGNILRAEIRDLRPTLRAVFEIKHLQEFSLRETAGKMGISLSAAKASAFQEKSALRKALTLGMNYRGGDWSLPHNVSTVHRRRPSQE